MLILLIYLVYIIYNYGVPKSISSTYYLLKHKYWFSLCLASTASIMLFQALAISPLNIQFLIFIAMAGVFFVAAAPRLDGDLEESVHTWSAVIALIFSLLWVIFIYPLLLFIWILMLIPLFWKKYKFYAEVIAMLIVQLVILNFLINN